jgi:hypothetical protein
VVDGEKFNWHCLKCGKILKKLYHDMFYCIKCDPEQNVTGIRKYVCCLHCGYELKRKTIGKVTYFYCTQCEYKTRSVANRYYWLKNCCKHWSSLDMKTQMYHYNKGQFDYIDCWDGPPCKFPDLELFK